MRQSTAAVTRTLKRGLFIPKKPSTSCKNTFCTTASTGTGGGAAAKRSGGSSLGQRIGAFIGGFGLRYVVVRFIRSVHVLYFDWLTIHHISCEERVSLPSSSFYDCKFTTTRGVPTKNMHALTMSPNILLLYTRPSIYIYILAPQVGTTFSIRRLNNHRRTSKER